MKKLIALLMCGGLLLSVTKIFGQIVPGASDYHEEALLFSQYNYTGSARIQGLGGAQVSLGGDISSALSNPAGLGFYNRSEFSITPSFSLLNSKSTYLGNSVNSNNNQLYIDNFGIVFNKKKDDVTPGAYRGGSFAISFSKTGKFNNRIYYQGTNDLNDIIDHFVQNANADNWTILTDLAYNTYAIDQFTDPNTNQQFYDRTVLPYPSSEYPVIQSESIETSGGQNQWSFSYGGNFADKFYFGLGLGITSLHYNLLKDYHEDYSGPDLSALSITEMQDIKGTAVNLSAGFIVRPINILTIGGSIISPSWYGMNEYSTFTMNTSFNNYPYDDTTNLNDVSDKQEVVFDYNMNTPLRLNGGATLFINKSGFITADVEFVNYSSTKLSGNGASLEDQNLLTQQLYRSTINYKIGGEYRLKNFRARAGFAYYGDPYENASDVKRDRMNITGGIGFRNQTFFMDLAVINSMNKGIYAPYTLDPTDNPEIFKTPYAEIDNNNLSIVISGGLFF